MDPDQTDTKWSLKPPEAEVNRSMEWWMIAPLIFAIGLFLVVGTIFEKRIEATFRRIFADYLHNSEPVHATSSSGSGRLASSSCHTSRIALAAQPPQAIGTKSNTSTSSRQPTTTGFVSCVPGKTCNPCKMKGTSETDHNTTGIENPKTTQSNPSLPIKRITNVELEQPKTNTTKSHYE